MSLTGLYYCTGCGGYFVARDMGADQITTRHVKGPLTARGPVPEGIPDGRCPGCLHGMTMEDDGFVH